MRSERVSKFTNQDECEETKKDMDNSGRKGFKSEVIRDFSKSYGIAAAGDTQDSAALLNDMLNRSGMPFGTVESRPSYPYTEVDEVGC